MSLSLLQALAVKQDASTDEEAILKPLRVPAAITKPGIFDYGRVRDFRPEEEVFDEESMASLAECPITIYHEGTEIDPANWEEHAVGHVSASGIHRDGDFLVASLVISDADIIKRIKAGELVEISAGYKCKMERVDNEEYEFVQRKIRYNHVTLLPRGQGRAGRDVQLRLDSKGFVVLSDDYIEDHMTNKKRGATVTRLDSEDAPVLEEEATEAESSGEVDEVVEEAAEAAFDLSETLAGIVQKLDGLSEKLDGMYGKHEEKEDSVDEEEKDVEKEDSDDELKMDAIEEAAEIRSEVKMAFEAITGQKSSATNRELAITALKATGTKAFGDLSKLPTETLIGALQVAAENAKSNQGFTYVNKLDSKVASVASDETFDGLFTAYRKR